MRPTQTATTTLLTGFALVALTAQTAFAAGTIRVHVAQTKTLSFPWAIQSCAAQDTKVLDVVRRTGRRVKIIGVNPGATKLVVVFSNGKGMTIPAKVLVRGKKSPCRKAARAISRTLKTVKLLVGHKTQVSLPQGFASIAVRDRKIADVRLHSKRVLTVMAYKAGRTAIIVTYKNNSAVKIPVKVSARPRSRRP